MRYLAVLLFFSVLFTSCGEDPSIAEAAAKEAAEAAQEKAYETMMDAHDRVMPMMGKITATQRSIMEAMKAEGVTDERMELLTAANEQLEDAGDKMMSWMGEMKPLDKLRAEMDSEAIMTYIREQAASVAKVETAMSAAVAAGTELVGDTHSHDGDGHDHDHKH